MAAKKTPTKKAAKGPRGPVLRSISLRELTEVLKADGDAVIQVSRRSVITHLEKAARSKINF